MYLDDVPGPAFLRSLVGTAAFTAAFVAIALMTVLYRIRSIYDICKAARMLLEIDDLCDELAASIEGITDFLKRYPREGLFTLAQKVNGQSWVVTTKDPFSEALNTLSKAKSRFAARVALINSLLEGIMSMRQKREEVSGLMADWGEMKDLSNQLTYAFQTAIRLPPVGLFAPSEGVELSDKEKIVWEKAKLMCEEEQKTWMLLLKRVRNCASIAGFFAKEIRDGRMRIR